MTAALWRKLRGDVRAARGRIALLIGALAVSLTGFGGVLGARAVLERAISASYLASHPADATIELAGDVDDALLAAVRARPEIAAAAAREALQVRVRTDGARHAGLHGLAPAPARERILLLFVQDDYGGEILALRGAAGAPPTGTMLVERSAVGVIGAGLGDAVVLTTPHASHRLAISGVVHDTALAPAWQEHRGYGYVTRATLAALGEPAVLHDLAVRFRPAPATQAEAEAAASRLARWLVAAGHPVERVRVPALHRHPHDAQMRTVQQILLVFTVLLLVLASILIATLLAALLARQTREIGVLKAIGATTAQLVALYAALVVAIAGAALAISLPLAHHVAQGFVAAAAYLLNLAVDDPAVPARVALLHAAAGLAVPLAAAAVPILAACRRTVRAALAHHGARPVVRVAPRWLPHAARNALRTPVRLALSIGLLAAGGAMAMTAVNLRRAYERNVARVPAMWHHDLDVTLREPASAAQIAALTAVPGVRVVEPWPVVAAARDERDVDHTYPDQGHGSFRLYGAPPASQLASLPIVAGRWLRPGDTDAIVVTRADPAPLGARISLVVDRRATWWTVVGIADPLPLNVAFVPAAQLPAARLLRIAFAPGADPTAAIAAALAARGATIESIAPFRAFSAAIADHVVILTRAALALAAVVALVGLLGLAAALGITVLERTREIAVLKAIGAGDAWIARLIVGEAVAIGVASWLVAALVSLPATYALDRFVAAQGFIAPVFVIDPRGIAGWLAAVAIGAAVASALPARRAARLTVRAALAEA